MKLSKKHLIILFSLILTGYIEARELDVRQTTLIQGLIYKLYEKEPFTGQVYNMSGKYLMEIIEYKKSSSLVALHGGTYGMWANNPIANCKVNFTNGIIDGYVECWREGKKVYEATYKGGIKNGKEEFSGYINNIRVFAPYPFSKDFSYRVSWKNGIKNGLEELYYLPDNKLVVSTRWSNGLKNGNEKIRIKEKSGEILADLNWDNGKLVSGYELNKSNNNVLEYAYKKGVSQRTNTLKKFSENYQQLLEMEIAEIDGNKMTQKYFDGNQKIIKEEKYVDGKLIDTKYFSKENK